jgi:uncharacterized protein YjcR
MAKAKGKNVHYGDREKEQAFALYAVSGNITEVAERLGIPRTTISTWIKNASPDELEELRRKQKERFIAEAWSIIGDAQSIIRRRMGRALLSEDAIDELVYEVENSSDEEISREEKAALIRKLRAISCEDLSKVATVMGTMYDKAALASKEATAIIGGSLTVEDMCADS